MPTIDDILDSALNSQSYYEEESKDSVIEEGSYKAKIVDLNRRDAVNTKNGKCCDIYKPVYEIDNEHPEFGGDRVKDRGLFRFYGSNQTGNLYYKRFLDKMKIPLNKTKQKNKTVFELPPLTKELIVGKEVMIAVFKQEWMGDSGKVSNVAASLTRIMGDRQ